MARVTGMPLMEFFIWTMLASCEAPIQTKKAMKSRQGLPNKTDQTEEESQALTNVGGDLGRLDVIHAHGKQGAQDTSAVHGEGGDQVEQHERQVHQGEALDQRAAGDGQLIQRYERTRQQEPAEEDARQQPR